MDAGQLIALASEYLSLATADVLDLLPCCVQCMVECLPGYILLASFICNGLASVGCA